LIHQPHFAGEISGEIYVIFALKVANNASSSTICTIRVAASGGVRKSRNIKPSDFPASNQWRHFALKARIHADDTNVYIDIYNFIGSITDLYVDFIGIAPTTVPLDFADVDTDSHSGTDTDEHGGTAAALAYADITEILNETDSNVAVAADTWTEIFSGTCGSEANAVNLARIYISIVRDVNFNNRKYFLRLDIGGSIKDIRYGAHWGVVGSPQTTPHQLYIYDNLSGDTVKIYLYAEGGASQYSTTVIVSQYKKHNHTMTDPDAHSVTQPNDHTETASGHEH